MVSFQPSLRKDLIIREQQTAHGRSVVVKHPDSGKFFRLEEAEHFIAQQLDGKTPFELIRRRTEAKFDAELTAETLLAFLQTLKKNGLLETEDSLQRDAGRKPKRFRGGPLYCRFKVFDPCQLLNWLVRPAGFFYTPYFGVLSAAIILLAAGILVSDWGVFRRDVHQLYHVSAIPLVLALNFLIVGAHEFGHGLTCTRFGGEVHEMGCAMVFLQPAFYCNVSDAWLFPEKSKRLWVGFAGPYFELFLWALATLVWRLTEADTWINFAGLSVMTTSGLKTLLNFNPLIKFDGYYLLSDFLEIPNLRRRSFRYVGSLVEKLFGWGSAAQEEENISPRERQILLIYGTIALTGSFSILGYILVRAGGSLVEGRTPTAVLISLMLLAMKFRRRFRRMFADPSGAAAGSFDDWDFDTAEETGVDEPVANDLSNLKASAMSDTGNGLKTSVTPSETDRSAAPGETSRVTSSAAPEQRNPLNAPSEDSNPQKASGSEQRKKRHRRRIVRRTLWLAAAALAVVALFYVRWEGQATGPLNILPVRNADVRTQIDGMIEEIRVTEGALVRKGDLIARLSVRENRSELEKTQGQIEQSRAKLRLQIAGPTPDDIELAKTAVVKAKDNVNYARVKRDVTKELFANNLTARLELETAEQQYITAKDDLADAEGKLKVLLNGTRPEEIDQTKAEISSLEAQQRFLQGQIARAEVRSPVDGIVATPELELKELAGQVVPKGALIVKVFELQKATVEIAVPESEIAEVEVGQGVSLRVRAYPKRTFEGVVTAVATSALSETSSTEAGSLLPITRTSSATAGPAKTVLVTTEIDNGSFLLKPGMTGYAKIFCGRRRLIDLIARRLARTIRVEFWSWW